MEENIFLKIYKIIPYTKAEGPGARFCIWVQGCSKHCTGCFAKETWDKNKGKNISVNEIFNEICKNKDKIEGVTFLGGEPFEQAFALSFLAKRVQELGLSVLTFSGLTYEELKNKKDESIDSLLEYTDLLIDGGYQKENFDISRPWVGSSNQRYIFLTDRYNEDVIAKFKNKIEVRINKKGVVFVNGMGNFDELAKKMSAFY